MPVGQPTRLALEALDARIVPANNLAIVNPAGTTTFVATLNDGLGTLTLSAVGAGATLRTTDIEAALATSGVTTVVVTTADPAAPDSGQAGTLTWNAATAGQMSFLAAGLGKTLRFRAAGDLDLTDVHFVNGDASNKVNLALDTTPNNGAIRLKAGAVNGVVFDPAAVNDLAITAGTGDIVYENAGSAAGLSFADATGHFNIAGGAVQLANAANGGLKAGGDLAISATSLSLGTSAVAAGSVEINAPVSLTQNVSVGRLLTANSDVSKPVTLGGTVDGGRTLTLLGTTVQIQQAIGGTTPLTGLSLLGGDVQYGSNAIRASTITVGDNVFNASNPFADLSGTGTLTGAVTVRADGQLRPGGAGVVGTMPVVGSVAFSNGGLGLDLGATSDQLQVTGNVNLNSGYLELAGALPTLDPVKVIDFSGTRTGTLTSPVGSPIFTGSDLVKVVQYGDATTDVTLAPFTITGNVVGALDFDGTLAIVRLIGPGALGAIRDLDGSLILTTHNTTVASTLSVTTGANASNELVKLSNVFVHGTLGTLSAPKAEATVQATGTIRSISLWTADAVTLGGTAANRTTLTARSVAGDVTSGGTLSVTARTTIIGDLTAPALGTVSAESIAGNIVTGAITALKTTGNHSGNVTATSLGTASVGATLGRADAGPRPTWAVTGGINSLTAGAVSNFDLSATFLNRLAVTGKAGIGLGANVSDAKFTLSGNNGVAAGQFGLKAVSVLGNVTDSLFDVKAGNVDSFTVGRFGTSKLYVAYTPAGAFNTGGTFTNGTDFRLNRFTTTAPRIFASDPTNPGNWGFRGSEVAADVVGTARISGLRTANGGTAFGLKFGASHGSVRVGVADVNDPDIKSNVDLVENTAALAGNFFFLHA